jgi:2-polyprenyl-6-methoxyphenol hydroxylase-like FAD-dependent oxidoreductase
MAQLKVLICGAGIAGNALAFWLSKMGHEVTVIERFPALRATGLQIDLRGHGIEVMRRMGLEPSFRAKSVKEQGLEVVDRSGRRRAYFPANRSGKGIQSFTTDFEILRGDLCRLLHGATVDRVKYVFGTSLESINDNDGFVEAVFSDGRKERFDLIVGADGQGSRTRRLILDADAAEPFHPLGVYIAYFTFPRPVGGDEYLASVCVAPQRRFVAMRRHNPREIQVYLACKPDSCKPNSDRLKNARKGDVVEEKLGFAEIFRGAGWQTDDILEALEHADDFYCERLGVVKLDCWSRGRVVLLGDAAFCPSATTGMGTTCSLVGAYILAGEIGNHCRRGSGGDADGSATKDALSSAFKGYEETFRLFIDQVQRGLSDGPSSWDRVPSTSFGISVLHFLLAIASFFRLDILARFVLRENVRGWALPDYDML